MKQNSTLTYVEEIAKRCDAFYREQKKQNTLLVKIYRQVTFLSGHIVENKASNRDAVFRTNCERFNITNKEKEIIVLIGQGYAYKQIADQLCISEHTVKKHIQNIFEKLQVHNNIQMLRIVYVAESTLV